MMIFLIKILLYSNSTSNLIIFFQNPIHSKQKNEEASTAIGIFLQTVSCRKSGKVWWKCRAFEIFFVTLCGFFYFIHHSGLEKRRPKVGFPGALLYAKGSCHGANLIFRIRFSDKTFQGNGRFFWRKIQEQSL